MSEPEELHLNSPEKHDFVQVQLNDWNTVITTSVRVSVYTLND